MSYSYDKFSKDVLIRKISDELGPEISRRIAIGNPLKLSPDFPPLHTVHATFTAHGAPSNSAVQGF